jgi:hypothetical protein
MEKKCTECKENKEINCFYNKKTSKDGKESQCKSCRTNKTREKQKEYNKTYERKNPRIVYISTKTYPTGKIICKKCNIDKELIEYYFDKSIENYKEICKDCKSTQQKENRKENREEINNKQRIQRKVQRKTNPQFRIREAFSSRIQSVVKFKSKSSKLLSKYLGCSFDEFIKWIQYQFVEGMTLDNYGSVWHIDHVKPCASYDLTIETEIYECMCWKNLRPCWKVENLKKSNKICLEIIEKHKNIVESYIKNKSGLIV